MLWGLVLLSLVFTWRQWGLRTSAFRAHRLQNLLYGRAEGVPAPYLSKCKVLTGGQGVHGAALGLRGEGQSLLCFS